MPSFMFDTNAFNRTLDSGVDPKLLSESGQLYVTHVQKNELQATKNKQRLEALLAVFDAVEQENVPTAAMVWDVSEWGGAEWGDADGLYDRMLASLNQRNGSKGNNVRDVLIGVTAIKRECVLVSDDADLRSVVSEHGGQAITFREFVN